MSDVKPFTIISGDANGVDLEADAFPETLVYLCGYSFHLVTQEANTCLH